MGRNLKGPGLHSIIHQVGNTPHVRLVFALDSARISEALGKDHKITAVGIPRRLVGKCDDIYREITSHMDFGDERADGMDSLRTTQVVTRTMQVLSTNIGAIMGSQGSRIKALREVKAHLAKPLNPSP